MSHPSLTSDTDRTVAKGKSLLRRAALAVGALAAAAALAAGGATAAQAAANPITSGHNDILKVETAAGGGVGTEFDDGSFESWPLATNYTYEFDLNLADPSVCSAGVITIPAFPASGQGPSVGFDNHSGSNYTVALAASKPVTFNGGSFTLSSGSSSTLTNGSHIHGSWTIDAGSCAANTVSLSFTAAQGSTVKSQSFTFDVK